MNEAFNIHRGPTGVWRMLIQRPNGCRWTSLHTRDEEIACRKMREWNEAVARHKAATGGER